MTETNMDYKERCERAEAAVLEMRIVIQWAEADPRKVQGLEMVNWYQLRDHALSTDCGKDFVPRAELDKAQAAFASLLGHIKNRVDVWGNDKDVPLWIWDSLSRLHALAKASDCGDGLVSVESVQAAVQKATDEAVESTRQSIARLYTKNDELVAKLTLALEALRKIAFECDTKGDTEHTYCFVRDTSVDAIAAIEKGQP